MTCTPSDWNNVDEWNDYFRDRISNEERPDDGLNLFSLEEIKGVAQGLRDQGVKTIWVPGCGLSLLPSVFAGLGFDVFATDASSVAVAHQDSRNFDLSCYEGLKVEAGFVAETHDLRNMYRSSEIDLILNVKAFQRFKVEEMEKVAKTHFTALRGKEAIFSTLNCQGSDRDKVEDSLSKAGFFIPFIDIERSFRSELKETGIPYALVLGRPIVPQVDENGKSVELWHDEVWRQSSKKTLLSIYESYMKNKNEAQQSQLEIFSLPETKFANIIYNTG